jgi:hypothetical protein
VRVCVLASARVCACACARVCMCMSAWISWWCVCGPFSRNFSLLLLRLVFVSVYVSNYTIPVLPYVDVDACRSARASARVCVCGRASVCVRVRARVCVCVCMSAWISGWCGCGPFNRHFLPFIVKIGVGFCLCELCAFINARLCTHVSARVCAP